MRIDPLTRRLASAPRSVVLGLVALSVLISPGFVRVARESEGGLEAASERGGLAAREVAVLELACPDGVFGARCTRLVAELTRALEEEPELFGAVRSLANARVVRVTAGELRLVPVARATTDAAEAERVLRARVNADASLRRRFVAPGGFGALLYAELVPGRSPSAAHSALDAIAAELMPGAESSVTLRGVGERRSARALLLGVALAFAALAFGLAPGGWRVALVSGVGALACAAFAHALLGLLGEPASALARFAPELWLASALAASFALTRAARAEHRRERAPRNSVASALALAGPGLALAALVAVCGFAALVALAPGSSRPLALAGAAALAAALVAYPLGFSLAGLILWPGLLSRARGELASALARSAEQVLLRPRRVAYGALASLAIATFALGALEPDPRALELRSVVLDSGARGGALEPAFLERVAAFQGQAALRHGVVSTSSLVDTALAPANRALHEGDALFATVPLTRVDVLRALEPWLRSEPAGLGSAIDAEQRRLAIELLVDSSDEAFAPLDARPFASALGAVVCVALVCAGLLRSARGGLLCAAPAALTCVVVLGLALAFSGGPNAAGAALAPVAAAVSAALGLQLLLRVRALLALGSQLEVALSLALRETGPSLAAAALASSAAIAALGALSGDPPVCVGLACIAPLAGAASALALLPPLVRALRGRFSAESAALHADVSALDR